MHPVFCLSLSLFWAVCFPVFAVPRTATPIRVDVRTSFGGQLATGVETLGTPSGSGVEAFDTTTKANGWMALSREGKTQSICIRNDIGILGGRLPSGKETQFAVSTNLVRHNLVVPKGATVQFPFGTVLKFTENTRIVAESGGGIVFRGVALADALDDSVGGDSDLGKYGTKAGNAGNWVSAPGHSWSDLTFIDGETSRGLVLRWTAGLSGNASVYGTLPRPADRANRRFGGWYTKDTGGQLVASNSPVAAGAQTLYARYSYAVALDATGGKGGTESVWATYGKSMPAIELPARVGHVFGGYYSGKGGAGAQYYTETGASARAWNMTSSTTLYAKWRAAAASTVWRFYSLGSKGHFFTISMTEKENLMATNPNWKFEGGAYRAYTNHVMGTVPLYRFYSQRYRGHFFTVDTAEMVALRDTNPNWAYEGIAYYVYPEEVDGSVPVFRFWNQKTKHHFFTISVAEKENLIAANPNWAYEGVAFWALSPEGAEGEETKRTTMSPVPVPHSWLSRAAGGILAAKGGDYEAAAQAKAANGRPVWQCYVAGLDPMDAESEFKAEMSVKGGILKVGPVDGEKDGRTYRVMGRKELGEETAGWTDVTGQEADWVKKGWRFFKVGVELE